MPGDAVPDGDVHQLTDRVVSAAPHGRLLGPRCILITLPKTLRGLGKGRGVVGRFVARHACPIERLGTCFRVPVSLGDFPEAPFGPREISPRERRMAQAQGKLRDQISGRQKAFDPVSFDTFGIEHQDRRCPLRGVSGAESLEFIGLFPHMNPHGNEVLLDEAGYPLVRVHLGIQPSTTTSHRRGAEVEEQVPLSGSRLLASGLEVALPIDRSRCRH